MLTIPNRRRRGRATVLLEFMMILPLFMFMTLFAVDMGRMILVAGAMNDAAYVSARAGAQRGYAGDPQNGPARNAFNRAVDAIPGTSSGADADFTIVRGTCNTANSYIVVEVTQDVDFITPGLGLLLGIVDRSERPGLGPTWQLYSRGAVLCEVVR